MEISELPGGDLILQGLEDLGRSKITIATLLISIGKTRLESAGLILPKKGIHPKDPELMLYELIGQDESIDSYSHYNSLIRQLISFEKALEQLP